MATSKDPTTLLDHFCPNSLYILLYRHPNPSIRFHWALYHHNNRTTGGWKFDIIQPNGIWQRAVSHPNGQPRTDVLDPDPEEPLACAVAIAHSVGGGGGGVGREKVHQVIMEDDKGLNKLNWEWGGGLSCRVYVLRACERLRAEGALGYQSWDELEREVLRVGEPLWEGKVKDGPTIVDSKFIA